MPTISFKNEDREKGIGIMMRSSKGFTGLGENKFGVPESMIGYLIMRGVEPIKED